MCLIIRAGWDVVVVLALAGLPRVTACVSHFVEACSFRPCAWQELHVVHMAPWAISKESRYARAHTLEAELGRLNGTPHDATTAAARFLSNISCLSPATAA